NGSANLTRSVPSSFPTTQPRRAPAAAERASTSTRRRLPVSLPPKAKTWPGHGLADRHGTPTLECEALNGRVKPGHIVMGCSLLDGTLLKAFCLCRALLKRAMI